MHFHFLCLVTWLLFVFGESRSRHLKNSPFHEEIKSPSEIRDDESLWKFGSTTRDNRSHNKHLLKKYSQINSFNKLLTQSSRQETSKCKEDEGIYFLSPSPHSKLSKRRHFSSFKSSKSRPPNRDHLEERSKTFSTLIGLSENPKKLFGQNSPFPKTKKINEREKRNVDSLLEKGSSAFRYKNYVKNMTNRFEDGSKVPSVAKRLERNQFARNEFVEEALDQSDIKDRNGRGEDSELIPKSLYDEEEEQRNGEKAKTFQKERKVKKVSTNLLQLNENIAQNGALKTDETKYLKPKSFQFLEENTTSDLISSTTTQSSYIKGSIDFEKDTPNSPSLSGDLDADSNQSNDTTTLSSVFDENLIPPLPNFWPVHNSLSSWNEDFYNFPQPEKASATPAPSPTIARVKIAGKADLYDSEKHISQEKVTYVTLGPHNQWEFWKSFSGRHHVDPLFDVVPDESQNVTQVFSVFWGNSESNRFNGLWIVRAGAAGALAGLLLTIAMQAVSQDFQGQRAMLITNLATSLAAAQLFFICGIQATDKAWVCGVVSLLLHFFHLVTCGWMLILSLQFFFHLRDYPQVPTAAYCIPVWGTSLVLVWVSYLTNADGYETRRYCWLSIERGMLVSFIAPVCSLILVNAAVCVMTQKTLLEIKPGLKPEITFKYKKELRSCVILLPLEAISWFLMVLALEDDLSVALDATSATVTMALGWLVFYLLVLVPSMDKPWSAFFARNSNEEDRVIPLSSLSDRDYSQPLLPTLVPSVPLSGSSLPGISSFGSPTFVDEMPLEPIYRQYQRRDVY